MKKSRIIAMLLAAAMVLSMIVIPNQVVTAEEQYTMYLADENGNSSVVAEPGDTIVLYLTIENNPGIIGVGAYIGYDGDALTLDYAEDQNLFISVASVTPSFSSDKAIPYYVSWAMPTGTKSTKADRVGKKLVTTDGDLMYLEFVVSEDAAPGEYEITLDVNSDETVKNANLTADVNADGAIAEEKVDPDTGKTIVTPVGNGTYSIFADNDDALVAVGCTIVVAGETAPTECTHSYTNYVSNDDATCEADGTKTATCDNSCGETDTVTDTGSATGHSYSTYTSNGDATCTEDGTKTATCDNGCGTTDTVADTGSATGHTFQGEWYYETAPSCTADGVRYQLCSACDAKSTAEVEEGSKLDHSYTGTELTYLASAANCHAKATYYYVCVNGCGAAGTEVFEYGEFDSSNHDGETEVRNAQAATEEAAGYTGDTYCLGCGEMIQQGTEIPKLDHTHSMTKHDYTPATCTTDGNIEYYRCDKCGKLYDDEVGTTELTAADVVIAAGHNLSKTEGNLPTCTADGNSEYWTCSVCGKIYDSEAATSEITLADTVIGARGHSYTNYVSDGNATCEADGTKTAECDHGCGKTDTKADEGSALGHKYSNYVSDGNATCEADGTKTAGCDHGCGATDTVTDAGSKLGHEYTNYVSNNDAACEADGTKTAECDHGCGKTDTVTEEGSALGHSFDNYVSNDDATCTEDGTKTGTCDRCHETVTVTAEGSALGHLYTNYVSNNDATCEADGTKTAACDHGCGTTDTIADEGTALGHKYTTYVSNNDATCEADGTKTAACDNGCGKTDTKVDEGTALGHEYTNYVSDGNATCTEDGTKTAVCDNGCGEKDTVADEGSKLGHDMVETAAKAATCTEAGNNTYYTCSRCNKVYKEVTGETETTVEAETLAALGHVYTNYVSNNDATCEADGTKTAVCDHGCGTTDTVTDAGTALGHKYTTYVSNNDATCEADGTKTAACDNGCGKTDTKVDEGTALGHVYTNYVSDGNATCTEDGTKTAACDNGCGKTHTVTEEGSALGHDYQDVTVDPTCTEKGYTGEKCSRCDDVIVTEETAALGHTEGEAAVENNVDPTCETEGGYDMVVRCTVCDEIITSTHYTVDALGHELIEHAAVEATEDKEGNILYYECECCDKLFAADKTTEITLADTVVEKLTPAPTEKPAEPNDSAQTGDSAHIAMALALMLVACMGTAVVVTVRKRFGN